MKPLHWFLAGALALSALAYTAFFTDWFAPAPIEIAHSVRPAVQPPRFSRRQKPEQAVLADAPNGVAHVTFSLDGSYALTSIKVVAETAGNKLMWSVGGKSRPLKSLLYGREPEQMILADGLSGAQPLEAGTRYRLEIASGRRRGTNWFQTFARPESPVVE
jgi:hypothetical protein